MSNAGRRLALVVLASLALAGRAAAQWSLSPAVDNALCTAAGAQDAPRLVPDGGGGLIAAWQDARVSAAESDVYAQRLDGAGVTQWAANGVGVCTATGAQTMPVAVSDGAGGVIVAWTDRRSGAADVYVQRLGPGGAALWAADGVPLCTASGDQQDVAIATDGANGAIVAWRDGRGDTDAIYAQRVLAGGTTSWTAQGVLVASDASADLARPTVSPTVASGSVFTWLHPLAQQLTAVRLSSTAAPVWAGPVVFGSSVNPISPPRVASDELGGVVAAWIDVSGDVVAQRVHATGILPWGAAGQVVCTAAGTQTSPDLVAGPSGGAYVVWQDPRLASTTRIFAQSVNPGGAQLWTPNGVELCVASLTQQSPVVVRSAAGGMIAAWKDSRGGLWGQRLDASGGALWADAGVAIAQQPPAAHDQTQITGEPGGGALLAFTNTGSGLDVYAKRVNAGGGFTLGAPRGDRASIVSLGRVAPNPLAARSVVRVTLARSGALDVAVFDGAGRRVATLADGAWPAGEHELRFSTRGWPRGVYFLRAAADGWSASRRVAKVE